MAKKVRGFIAFTACLLLLVGIPLTAYGAYSVAGKTVNYVSTATYGTEILEEYNPPEYVQPGAYVDKVVTVKNLGEAKTIVRVKLVREFSKAGLDPDMILLDIDDKHWVQKGEWYYYKGILGTDEETRYPLLKGFTLSDEASDEYKSVDGHIIVIVESMQYDGGFAEEAWGMSYQKLGIKEPSSANMDYGKSTIEYTGSRFLFNRKNGDDLFLNFKELMPGQVRTQAMQITNRANHPDSIDLSYMFSQDTDEQLKELMHKHINITIKNMNGDVMYDGSIGGRKDSCIPLGEFRVGETKELIVSAEVDPYLSAEYRGLKGSVDWAFVANGREGSQPVTSYFVKTGDSYLLLYIGAGLVLSGCVLLYIYVKKRCEVVK